MTGSSALRIAADHPAFAGHFPGSPIVPGVVLLDEALVAIAAALQVRVDRCRLAQVKFRSVVRPGQALALSFESTSPGTVRFLIATGSVAVAEGTLTLAAQERQQ